MLSGKRFRLFKRTIAVENVDGERVAVQLPSGAIIRVKSGPTPTTQRLVDIEFDGRELVMFYEDIRQRCEEVTAES